METVRVLLAGMSPLLRDVVRAALANQPDVEIVAGPEDDAAATADVVVFSAGAGVADDIIGLALDRSDPPRLVIVAADGSQAYNCTPSGELSAAALRDAITGKR